MSDFEASYVGQLRKVLGPRQLIIAGARGVVVDDSGCILLTRRRDNGLWVMPAGAIELNESIYECLEREIKEETGLQVIAATPIAIYTEARFNFVNAFEENHQMFALVFRIDKWRGKLLTETDETIDACFFHPNDFPETTPKFYRETAQDLQNFNGSLIVK
jgi:8-oxo-dGTP pyrophosphatase MutT (NUDIX family)